MLMKVERFFSLNGYEYKSSANTSIIKTNYTLGLLLRKLYVISENDLCTYVLKQESILKKIFYNLFWLLYSPTSKPIYVLYKDNVKIGRTEKFKNHTILFKIDGYKDFKLIYDSDKKNHIIKIVENELIISKIIKNRFRYGKKNIYNVIYDNWNYDKDLLLLIVAFCDVVFFPELPLFKYSAIEYDLK